MIDTVNVYWPHLRFDPGKVPSNWSVRHSELEGAVRDGRRFTSFNSKLWCPSDGLTVIGNGSLINRVEFSVPKVLFGTNKHLITKQAEIERAFRLVESRLSQLGEPLPEPMKFNRVDLVWHFPGRILDFIPAHLHCRHPHIRSSPLVYSDQSINWMGSELKIRMYDKKLKEDGMRGDYVRVEVEMRRNALRKHLGAGSEVEALDIQECYSSYRNVILGFDSPPASIPKDFGIFHLLAAAEAQQMMINGVSPWYLWAANKSTQYVRRAQKKIAALRPEMHRINWRELMPQESLPPVYPLRADD